MLRDYYGPQGNGTHHACNPLICDSPTKGFDPTGHPEEREELDRWFAFHDAVANLPVEEREAVGLLFYHGWTQAEVAALFGVTERTVRRRWTAALEKVQHKLKAIGQGD